MPGANSFYYGHWQEAFEETGLDPDFIYNAGNGQRTNDSPAVLSDAGVDKSFLLREWNHARSEKVTPNCRTTVFGMRKCLPGRSPVLKVRVKFGERRRDEISSGIWI